MTICGIMEMIKNNMKKIKYNEGDWFEIKLKSGKYFLGRIARTSKKPGEILGYFIGPSKISYTNKNLKGFNASNTRAIYIHGHLNIINGKWKLIKNNDNWKRNEWPISVFVRHEDFTERYWRVEYTDDIYSPSSETRISKKEAEGLQDNSLYGVDAVEVVLEKI